MGGMDHAQRFAAPGDREALSRDMSKLRDPRSGARAEGRGRRPKSPPSSGDINASGRRPGFRISRAGWATLAAILLSALIWAAVIAAVLFVRHNFVVHGG